MRYRGILLDNGPVRRKSFPSLQYLENKGDIEEYSWIMGLSGGNPGSRAFFLEGAGEERYLLPNTDSNTILYQKKFYTRETIRGIRISRLAEIPSFFDDLLR